MIGRLRGAALAVAILALLGIGLRPTRRVTISITEAMLVTPGADPSSGAVQRVADSLHATVYAGADALRRARPALRRLHMVGYGLEAEEWRDLDSIPLVLHPTALPAGLRSITWPAIVPLGDQLIVEGVLAGGGRGGRNPIVLYDPAGVAVDTTALGADGTFRIAATPRGVGQHRYTLQGETLSVMVVPPPGWRVLVLEASPSFETAALRDWLTRTGGGVIATRTTISRDRVRTEFVNLERTALSPVTGRLLEQFDAVVIDGATLLAMAGSERATLRAAVERGLGVLIVPDTTLFAPPPAPGIAALDREFFFGFTPVRIPELDVRQVRPSRPDTNLTVSVSAAPYHLAPRFGVATTMQDGSGATLAQVAPRGAGRVGVSLVTGAAAWRRAGADAAFATYWSRLLAAIATGPRGAAQWTIESPGPWFVDQPVTIVVTATRPIAASVVTGPGATRDSVFLAPDPLEPARQRGVYWPRESGWYTVEGGAGFFAQSRGTWTTLQAMQRRSATERHAVEVGGNREGGASRAARDRPASESRRPISALWFFAAFLAAAGVLWSGRRPVRP